MARRIDMTRLLDAGPPPPVVGLRRVSPDDRLPLGRLLLDAYRGTIDAEEDSLDAALAEIDRTRNGAYGPYLPAESCVVERHGALASAVLLTHWQERPLVAFAMTLPDYQRQGLARACMLHAMHALHASGFREVSLVVTVGNEPALRLYQALSFIEGR